MLSTQQRLNSRRSPTGWARSMRICIGLKLMATGGWLARLGLYLVDPLPEDPLPEDPHAEAMGEVILVPEESHHG